MNKKFVIVLTITVLLLLGYFIFSKSTSKNPATQTTTQSASQTPSIATSETSSKVLAGKVAQVLDFNKTDYKAALKSDKLIVLYFYANWCPICREEVPKFYSAFEQLTTDKVVGFRVNYIDSATDGDEKGLAREFGIAYQHTKVFLKNNQRVLKSPEAWEKERYLSEIQKAL